MTHACDKHVYTETGRAYSFIASVDTNCFVCLVIYKRRPTLTRRETRGHGGFTLQTLWTDIVSACSDTDDPSSPTMKLTIDRDDNMHAIKIKMTTSNIKPNDKHSFSRTLPTGSPPPNCNNHLSLPAYTGNDYILLRQATKNPHHGKLINEAKILIVRCTDPCREKQLFLEECTSRPDSRPAMLLCNYASRAQTRLAALQLLIRDKCTCYLLLKAVVVLDGQPHVAHVQRLQPLLLPKVIRGQGRAKGLGHGGTRKLLVHLSTRKVPSRLHIRPIHFKRLPGGKMYLGYRSGYRGHLGCSDPELPAASRVLRDEVLKKL